MFINRPNQRLPKNLREAIFIVILLLFGYVFLMLLTYSSDDPSLSATTSVTTPINNIGGVVGAYTSALLFEIFGRSAYLLCLVILLAWGTLLFRPFGAEQSVGRLFIVIGMILFMLSSSALEYLRFHYNAGLPAGAGGWIGHLVANSMTRWFGSFGSSLLLMSLWILSWSLIVNLSWFAFFETIGHSIEKLARLITTVLQRWYYEQRSRRDQLKKETLMPPHFSALTSLPKKPRPYRKKTPVTSAVIAEATDDLPDDSPLLDLDYSSSATNHPLPSVNLLDEPPQSETPPPTLLQATAQLIEDSLLSFKVSATVVGYHPGPVVTRYDLRPATGVKGVQIVNLARDLARSLSVSAIRVLETIPGTNYIGLEIPNKKRSSVNLSEILSSDAYQDSDDGLPLALGETATGQTAIADLVGMPHLLVAGSTGSGKSVFINAILLSLLFARTPQQLRLLLIDPKMLELATYADIPHLLAPVVTDMSLAPIALHWVVEEMERRYQLIAKTGLRHITSYNEAAEKNKIIDDDGNPQPPMPYIVVIIDELADLMMVSGKKVELSISRLAQKARASGIHMVLATQRPSVDVITGLIKANIPCRLSFQIASKVDSRTILDQMGAETLLGKGDMLYLPTGAGIPQRLHGAFVSDEEVQRVVAHIRKNGGKAEYLTDFSDIVNQEAEEVSSKSAEAASDGESDALYDQAVEAVLDSQRASISLVQRKLRIGYNRAARLVESMEKAGLVSTMNEVGARKVLIPKRKD